MWQRPHVLKYPPPKQSNLSVKVTKIYLQLRQKRRSVSPNFPHENLLHPTGQRSQAVCVTSMASISAGQVMERPSCLFPGRSWETSPACFIPARLQNSGRRPSSSRRQADSCRRSHSVCRRGQPTFTRGDHQVKIEPTLTAHIRLLG